MRHHHFELLQPLCPRCMHVGTGQHRLVIGQVEQESDGKIWEGLLVCENNACRSEYPIMDGIPILLYKLRSYISENIFQINARDDLSATTQSLIGDCCSQNSLYDATRQHLSCYCWDHFGEFDPLEQTTTNPEASTSPGLDSPQPGSLQPGSLARAIRNAIQADFLAELPSGPILDAGCGVGRTAFELSQLTGRDVLAIDMNYSMLRTASQILRDGRITYGKRRSGLVYEHRQFDVHFEHPQRVDFWLCDVTALPIAHSSFAAAVAMNLLDSLASPRELVKALLDQLKTNGELVLATPYDWSTAVTPVEEWLGGHSQRGAGLDSTAIALRQLLTDSQAVDIQQEWPDVEWNVRMHDRSLMAYRMHMLRGRRLANNQN